MSLDLRNKQHEKFKDNEIKENVNYLRDRYDDLQAEEDYYLDIVSDDILFENKLIFYTNHSW